jgi:hypothetical protein
MYFKKPYDIHLKKSQKHPRGGEVFDPERKIWKAIKKKDHDPLLRKVEREHDIFIHEVFGNKPKKQKTEKQKCKSSCFSLFDGRH